MGCSFHFLVVHKTELYSDMRIVGCTGGMPPELRACFFAQHKFVGYTKAKIASMFAIS